MTHDPGDPMLSADAGKGASHHETVEPPYINVRSILTTGAGLVLLVVGSMGAMWGFLSFLTPRQPASTGQEVVDRQDPSLPGEPGVDPEQKAHRLQYDAAQKELLTSYGWVDKKAGIARIPIERAMELMQTQAKAPREERE